MKAWQRALGRIRTVLPDREPYRRDVKLVWERIEELERRPRNRNPGVQGRCPRGCGETLFLGDGGYVTCSGYACPEPDAAYKQLANAEAL